MGASVSDRRGGIRKGTGQGREGGGERAGVPPANPKAQQLHPSSPCTPSSSLLYNNTLT